MNVSGLHWWSVNIGTGNGLVLSGNKPLPEPVLPQICRHMASLGHSELIQRNSDAELNGISFVVRPNKLLNKLSSCQWIETPWRSYDVTNEVDFSFDIYLITALLFPRVDVSQTHITRSLTWNMLIISVLLRDHYEEDIESYKRQWELKSEIPFSSRPFY